MAAKTLVVFTYRAKEEIVEEGGSQAWALNPSSASRCSYLVCTRNRYHEGAGPETHHSAFLVAKITGVEVAPESKSNLKGPWRYIVRFDEYALVEVLSDHEVNLGVWDFGVHPDAKEDAEAIRPEPQRPATLERRKPD